MPDHSSEFLHQAGQRCRDRDMKDAVAIAAGFPYHLHISLASVQMYSNVLFVSRFGYERMPNALNVNVNVNVM